MWYPVTSRKKQNFVSEVFCKRTYAPLVPEPVPWGKSAISSAVLGMDQDNGLCGLLSLEVGGASSLRLGIVLFLTEPDGFCKRPFWLQERSQLSTKVFSCYLVPKTIRYYGNFNFPLEFCDPCNREEVLTIHDQKITFHVREREKQNA